MHSISTKKLIMAMEENIISISSNQSKVLCLINEVSQNYFNQNIEEKQNENMIIFYYNSNSLKTDIIFDYLLNTEQEIAKLKELYYKLFEKLVQENTVIQEKGKLKSERIN